MSFSSWLRSYKYALSHTILAKPTRRCAARNYTRRLELEALEDRVVPSVTLLENFPNINIHQTALVTPPDTQMAVGLDTVVGAVNRAITLTDKTGGARVGPIQTNTFFSPIGNPTGRYGDPQVLYDDQAGRFYVCAIEFSTVSTLLNTIDFAASKTNSPATLTAADWTFFPRITSVNEGGTQLIDFPKMGWNNDAVFVSTNQFSASSLFNHNLILSISKVSILAGGPLDTQQTAVNIGSALNILIPARMHNEAPGNLEYFVQATGGGDPSTTINVVKESGYLSGPGTFTTTSLTVNAYTNSPGVPGLALPLTGIDDRLLSADWVNNGTSQHMVASGNVGSDGFNLARWYEINAPTAGAPSLLQQGDINPGGGVSTSYPSIAINPNDAIAMTFLETGGGQSTAMYVTGRVATDPLNAMQELTLVQAGSLPIAADSRRGGDYSATEYDPAAPDTFWSANEFQLEYNSPNFFWGTQTAQYSVTALAPAVSLTAANTTYAGSAYNTANLIAVVTPAAASGSISNVFYSDWAGQSAIATPINAGVYYVQAFFISTSSGYTNANSAIVLFNIAKANASFNVTPYTGSYDGLSHNIIVVATGVGSDGNLSSLVTLGPSKTDAGSYSGAWSFSGNGNYNPANGAAAITITAKSLTVDATTQGTLNIAKAGTISFALQITAGLVSSNNDVAALFNGAVFTIVVEGTSYSLTSTATVASDGTINVSMQMSQGLQNALLTALSEGSTVDFSLSALSNDNDYSIDADAFSRLINQGKLKFAVV
jgi:hypothetical protein